MLYRDFLRNTDRPIISKGTHYFPIYEKYLSKYINKPVVFLEIGVFKGGSLQMWKRYLGPHATIIGIDIDPECKTMEEHQIYVRIGDQSDPEFLQSVLDEFGTPDVILDDGSHRAEHTCAAFRYLYDKLDKNGVYLVEDLVAAYSEKYQGGLKREGTFIELSKDLIDSLNAMHCGLPMDFANQTQSISFYPSMVVFEKMKWPAWGLATLSAPEEADSTLKSGIKKVLGISPRSSLKTTNSTQQNSSD